jgi:molybdopterin molybdotransferase
LAELLSLEEAQSRILARAVRLPLEQVELAEAAGRFPAEPATARIDLPPFDASAMDGFAVSTEDTPGRLPVVERIAAGRPASRALRAGEAMGIATGAAVPDGADAVIPLEYVVDHGNRVEIGDPVEVGANIRPRGGDLRAGNMVVSAGVRLGPAQLGALAAAGVADISTTTRPRRGALDRERAAPAWRDACARPDLRGEQRPPRGAARVGGAAVEESSRWPTTSTHRAALQRGLEADVLVTSGGVSVGPDLVRSVGAELGIEEVLWGVAVKPGKPLWFGARRDARLGCRATRSRHLSASSSSCGGSRPGCGGAPPRFEPGRLARSVRPNAVRTELVRARSRVVDGASSWRR